MKRTVLLAVALTALMLLGSSSIAQNGYRVIVHSTNSSDSLSKEEISRIFQKRTTRWSDGTATEPVDQIGSSAVREAFSRDVHGRSVSSIKNFWQRQIFSGKDVPPPELDNDAAVIAHVRNNPGAIGYVSTSAATGVKVLNVTD